MHDRLTNRRDIKVLAAKMYYIEGLSQVEIADKMHLSRPSISRLLDACIKEGIVQIYIDDVSSYGATLARQIKDRYDLKHVIVVPQSYNPEADKIKVGQAAAAYIESFIENIRLIGISWGTTIYHVVNNIRPNSYVKTNVIELVGGRENKTTDTDSNAMALKLSKTLNGDCFLLQAPFMVQSRALHDLLMEEPYIKSHFEKIKEADLAVVGLGSSRPELSAQFRAGHITVDDTQQLIRQGVVGDICGSYIDIHGRICRSSLSDRMTAIGLHDLQKIHTVIGVAAGEEKAEIMVGALRGKYMDVLITDEKAAIKVLHY